MKLPAKKVFSGEKTPASSMKSRRHRLLRQGLPGGRQGAARRRARLAGDAPLAQPQLGPPRPGRAARAAGRPRPRQRTAGTGCWSATCPSRAAGRCRRAMPATRSGSTPTSGSPPCPTARCRAKEREEIQATRGGQGPQAHRPQGVDGSACAAHQARGLLPGGGAHLRSSRRSRPSSANGPRATAPGLPRCAPISGTTIISTSASTARTAPPTARTSRRRRPRMERAAATNWPTGWATSRGRKPPKPDAKPPKPTKPAPPLTLAALPAECRAVVTAE